MFKYIITVTSLCSSSNLYFMDGFYNYAQGYFNTNLSFYATINFFFLAGVIQDIQKTCTDTLQKKHRCENQNAVLYARPTFKTLQSWAKNFFFTSGFHKEMKVTYTYFKDHFEN